MKDSLAKIKRKCYAALVKHPRKHSQALTSCPKPSDVIKLNLREVLDALALGDQTVAFEERPQVVGFDSAVVAQIADK